MSLRFADYRTHFDSLIDAALRAADPERAVRAALHRDGGQLRVGGTTYQVGTGRVLVIAAGKAALAMTAAAADVLGDSLSAGVAIAKETAQTGERSSIAPPIACYYAGHPVSNSAGVEATAAALRLLADTTARDLVLCLISGGASALLTQPVLPLELWQTLVAALLESGCDITELNLVRRQLDRVKGGGLLRAAQPATCLSLILSDVVGNPLASIGSGPTVPEAEAGSAADTAAAALDVLERYDIEQRLPADAWRAVVEYLRQAPGPEALPAGPYRNLIIGDVRRAAEAAAADAAGLGFQPQLLTTTLTGEAREAGHAAARAARMAAPGACLIWAGETTVTVRGSGRGGRNQEAALAASLELASVDPGPVRVAVASFATDGEDRIAGVAGAVVTDRTAALARAEGLDPARYLSDNDSFGFFNDLAQTAAPDAGGLLVMPPTGTNVNDLLVALTYSS